MFPSIQTYCNSVSESFDHISSERKALLNKMTEYVSTQLKSGKPAHLVYICTHNSRRSHFGQIWAYIASRYYGIDQVYTYSGGTEATALHPNAIQALKSIGLKVEAESNEANPVYQIYFSDDQKAITCFSKVYNHPQNPQHDFAAIMTCGDAEENCPFIPGASLRIATTYNDPKAFDGTDQQEEKYLERCTQIARECFYVFSQVDARSH